MSDAGWNFADVWETIATAIPDAPALAHGEIQWTWSAFERRADVLADNLRRAGLEPRDKVAQYLYNGPEYLESVFAAFKASLVPVNTNYRYTDEELVYLWDNADVAAVVFHGSFTTRVERIRNRLANARIWLWVDDDTAPCPPWAQSYEETLSRPVNARSRAWDRSGDDIIMLYTGGTTGMPKGVMWRQDDLYRAFSDEVMHDPDQPDLDAVRQRVTDAGPAAVVASPLMHGTGLWSAFQTLCLGGEVVTLTSRQFNVDELLDTVQRARAKALTIVGDVFSRPIVRALDEHPERWDISSLRIVTSSGVMWSQPVKEQLLSHNRNMVLVDVLGSSEALGLGASITSSQTSTPTGTFKLGRRARVLTDDGADVIPGSGVVGQVVVRGHAPVGYFRDPAKSMNTFVEIDGERYVVSGDRATVESDGAVRLLGRGSLCINTGGEKVYPEEVEEVLKEYPGVRDAAVFGLPHETFGEIVVAIVQLAESHTVDEAALIAHVRRHLAGYKVPKRVLTTDGLHRAPNGKLDYDQLRRTTGERL